jgi:hypothetical protein
MRIQAIRAAMLIAAVGRSTQVATAQRQSLDSAMPKPTASAGPARAVRAESPIRLDGALDDGAWRAAPRFGDFIQQSPNEGRPATERTEFQVAYTDDALHVAIRAFDSKPEGIAALLSRRDEQAPSDEVTVSIDGFRDRRTGFSFSVNAAGVKRDALLFDDSWRNESWDAVWDAKVRIDAEGWTAELRIPWGQLRFAPAPELVLGFNVSRRVNRLNETQFWRLPPKNAPGFVSLFGDLVGISGVTPPRRLEVLPYTATSQLWRPAVAGNPFRTGVTRRATLGGDVKLGVTSALTLTATINPDFGQVEADPAVVNLSAFESFFSERRPFFTEGSDVFRFRIADGDGDGSEEVLFYTRRIGRAPQGWADPRGGFAEQIDRTTILGAGKLSGKTRSGWTLGLLGALTAEETARALDGAGGWHRDVVEPRTLYTVGRAAREMRRGQTVIGLMGTLVERDLPDRLSYLHSSAYTGGLNWQHRFRNDTYQLSGRLVGSLVRGSTEAILLTQRSSARYYQRPDADYVELDSTRTSLGGFAFNVNGGRTAGNWRWNVGVDVRSPGFEVNDVGFQREADRVLQGIWVNRRWLQPGRIFRRFNVNLNQWSAWTFGWDRRSVGANVNANYQLLNYLSGWFGLNRNWRGLHTTALRGGPSIKRPGATNGWFGFETDNRKTLRGGGTFWIWVEDETGGSGRGGNANLSWRPAANVDLTASPAVEVNRNEWQYLATPTVAGQPVYLFGELRQTTTSLTFRSNLTFSPTLSLQLYAQPFVSSGRYAGFKRVVAPRADRFLDQFDRFGPDRAARGDSGEVRVDLAGDGTLDLTLPNPDFRVLSFRSNAVLRWEYQLGSTIFLVWQHGRRGFDRDGRFDLSRSLGDLFRSESENVLLLKVSYWLNP